MSSLLRKTIPKSIRKYLRQKINLMELKKNYKQDMEKFKNYSFLFGKEKTKRHYEAELIFYYHKIEKGLSLPNPRVGFGNKNVEYLLSILEDYTDKYGWDDISLVSLDTLFEYYQFNKNNNLNLINLYKRIKVLEESINGRKRLKIGGVRKITKEEITSRSNINFKDFAYSRYSIRNFAPGDIEFDVIKEAVYIAQKTPSVCNRQSSRVYVYNDKKLINELLKYQNGNGGFGDKANKIIIVTSDLKNFRGINERYQSYIDGGMYSMSLIYALHSLGVGTCPLNLSITNDTEIKLKKVAHISDSEVLLMMIAIGNIPHELNVASSPRRDVDEIIKYF